MSDSDFVDVGDEVVVRIGGYPVGKACVVAIVNKGVLVTFHDAFHDEVMFTLPLDFKKYDAVDGVNHHVGDVEYGHGSQPLRDPSLSLKGVVDDEYEIGKTEL